MIKNDIVEEAKYKIHNEALNLYNTQSYFKESSDSEKIYEFWRSPIFSTYYNLLADSIQYLDYDVLYMYKPEYVSYNIYQTSSYDYLVLHANRMDSKKLFKKENFDNGKIAYYSKEVIDKISKDFQRMDVRYTDILNNDNYLLYKI